MTSKKLLINTFTFLLLLAIILSSAIACESQGNSQETGHDFFGSETPIEQQVVLNQNGIKITLIGAETDKFDNPGFKFKIENNNSDPINFSTQSPYLNGILFDTNSYTDKKGMWFTSLELDPNSGKEFTLSYDKELLLELGINEIHSFDFSVSADLSPSIYTPPKTYLNSQPISIKTKLYNGSKQNLSSSGITIFEKDGIKIKINKYSVSNTDALYLTSENNTDKDFACLLTNIHVNEKLISNFSINTLSNYGELVHIPAKAVAIRPLYIIADRMDRYDIDRIDEISFICAMGFAENPNSIWFPENNPNDYASCDYKIDFNAGKCEILRFYDPTEAKTRSLTLGQDELSLLSEKDFSISLTSFDAENLVLNLEITNQRTLPCQYYFHNIKINGNVDAVTKDTDFLKSAPRGTSIGHCSIARVLQSEVIGGAQSGPVAVGPAFDPINSISFELVVIDEETSIIIYRAEITLNIPTAD